MEHMINGKCQISKVTPEDAISILPEGVITNILDCLPIQDAVRTSILSRKWRYKWTALTQLVFDKQFVEHATKGSGFTQRNPFNQKTKDFDLVAGRTISRLLLHIKGAIRKFVLYIPYDCYYSKMDNEDINNWVMLLSTKGIREFTLINMRAQPLELSTHLLSCTDLKHLMLHNCCLRRMTTFRGFPNLLTLDFNRVRFKDCKYGELITLCTSLEVLKLNTAEPTGNVKLADIAKLENLKVLSLTVCELENLAVTTSDIFQLMASLRKLQNLALDFENFPVPTTFWQFTKETAAGNRASFVLPGLKSLSLYNLNLSSVSMVLFTFHLILYSRNLQTLKIMAAPYQDPRPPMLASLTSTSLEMKYIMGLKELRIVEYGLIIDSEIQLSLIESLLAYCSSLEKMVLYYNRTRHSPIYYLDLAEKLIAFPRASPIAKIHLVNTSPIAK